MGSLASPSSRTMTVGAMSQIYTDHFALAVDRLKDPARAFEVLETARGRTAADVCETGSPHQRIPTEAHAYEREIARLQTGLMRSLAREERKDLLEKLFDAEQELYAAKFSGSQRLMEKGDPVQLANFQQELRPDELVLEYALGESTSYALVIDDSEIRVVRLPGRGRIEGIVEQYLTEIRARKAATELGQQLYAMLLGSIPEYLAKAPPHCRSGRHGKLGPL